MAGESHVIWPSCRITTLVSMGPVKWSSALNYKEIRVTVRIFTWRDEWRVDQGRSEYKDTSTPSEQRVSTVTRVVLIPHSYVCISYLSSMSMLALSH